MAVKREDLAKYISELGLPEEQSKNLTEMLMANESAAVQFVGQRLRHDDYTRGKQGLADEKRQITEQANTQLTAYAGELQKAQDRITKIMNDLEKEQISSATANARLMKVKETFNLSDDDIPAIEGVRNPAGTGSSSSSAPGQSIDIDARLKDFRSQLIKDLMPEMVAVMNFNSTFSDIRDQHRELTGKTLTRKEFDEIAKHAKDTKLSFERAWEDKYGIRDLRETKSDEAKKTKWRQEWDDEQRKRNSDDALAGVRRVDSTQSANLSPVLSKKFQQNSDPARTTAPADKSPAPASQPSNEPRLSGAERAAAKFMERRANGIPIGAPEQGR